MKVPIVAVETTTLKFPSKPIFESISIAITLKITVVKNAIKDFFISKFLPINLFSRDIM